MITNKKFVFNSKIYAPSYFYTGKVLKTRYVQEFE